MRPRTASMLRISIAAALCATTIARIPAETGVSQVSKRSFVNGTDHAPHRELTAKRGEWFTSTNAKGSYYDTFDGKWKASAESAALEPTHPKFDVDRCAKECFVAKECSYFSVDKEAKCTMYSHVKLEEDTASETDFGFIMSAPPGELSRAVTCKIEKIGNNDHFCVKDATHSFYLKKTDEMGNCVLDKMTLFRAAQVSYYTTGTIKTMDTALVNENILNGFDLAPDTIESGKFSLKTYLDVTTKATPLFVVVKHVTPIIPRPTGANENKMKYEGDSTKWSYTFDKYGRVKTAAAQLDKNTQLGVGVRNDYCTRSLQGQFNALRPLPAGDNLIAAGHVVACQFTNPQGFCNFVVQNERSNSAGCWGHSEEYVSSLLAKGCEGNLNIEMEYFNSAVEHKTFKGDALLFTEKEWTEEYKTRPTKYTKPADYECSFFHRPPVMKLTFKITGATPGTACEPVAAVVKSPTNKLNHDIFSLTGDMIKLTRPMLDWATDSQAASASVHKMSKLKAYATTASGRCFNELGASLSDLELDDTFVSVYLYVNMVDTSKPKKDASAKTTGDASTTTAAKPAPATRNLMPKKGSTPAAADGSANGAAKPTKPKAPRPKPAPKPTPAPGARKCLKKKDADELTLVDCSTLQLLDRFTQTSTKAGVEMTPKVCDTKSACAHFVFLVKTPAQKGANKRVASTDSSGASDPKKQKTKHTQTPSATPARALSEMVSEAGQPKLSISGKRENIIKGNIVRGSDCLTRNGDALVFADKTKSASACVVVYASYQYNS